MKIIYNGKITIDLSIVIFLLFIFSFSFRFIKIMAASNERGGYAYVQLLNFGAPFLEETFEKAEYAENKATLKNICLKVFGISDINSLEVVSDEIPYFDFAWDTLCSNKENELFVISENSINVNEVEKTELKQELDESKPEILIYHTHTMEGYAQECPDSLNEEYSVVGVGNALEKELESTYGISVIHDKTNHCVTYTGCYKRSRKTVMDYIDKYKDFKMIIDLHRDSTDNKNAVTTNINGENVAKVMFVNSKNSTRYEKNKKLSDFMYNKFNELFPGMTRKTVIYRNGIMSFHQDLNDNSVLIECGSIANSSEEAQNSAKYIARVIAEYLNQE